MNMKRNEIRIVDPSKEIWDAVTTEADKNMRSNGKQAEFMIKELLEIKKKKSKKSTT